METWRQIQKTNFKDWKTLKIFLELKEQGSFFKHPSFPLNLPLRLAKKIEKGNLSDPILLQFFPQTQESTSIEGFFHDPVHDTSFQKTPRLLQKYPGRVLLIVTSACVMNCRFCFRRNYPYGESPIDFSKELRVIANDPSIHEVILSGGDPLSIGDEKLASLIQQLSSISHVELLRFHTRFPIGIPERITPAFLDMLGKTRLQTIFILHTNHPRELDADIFCALKRLQEKGIPILTQTVLLRRVNDDFETLAALFLGLVKHGALPYYLHQLDRIQGAAHFDVPIEKGLKLVDDLRKALPGYAIPTYVQEVPHHFSKTPL